MKVEETPQQLVLKDSPGCMWLFGLFFIAIGSVFVLGPLFFNSDRFEQPWYVNGIAVSMGAIAVGVGLWQIIRTPATTLILDRLNYRLTLRQGWRSDRRERSWRWDEAAGLRVVEDKDDEGSPVYRLQMVLRSGEPVWLTMVSSHGRNDLDRAVEAVDRFTGWKSAGTM